MGDAEMGIWHLAGAWCLVLPACHPLGAPGLVLVSCSLELKLKLKIRQDQAHRPNDPMIMGINSHPPAL
jgi:hypothetical protein